MSSSEKAQWSFSFAQLPGRSEPAESLSHLSYRQTSSKGHMSESELNSGQAKSKVKPRKDGSKRLQRKVLIFQVLENEPGLQAAELIEKMQLQGVKLTRSSAYRHIAKFREGTSLAESEVRCLKVVSGILQGAAIGEHLTARQISERIKATGHKIHRSTIYRVLERLCSSSLVLTMRRGRQTYYEWKREEGHHGHLTCIECGKTIEFHHDDLDEVAKSVCNRTGYEFARIEFLVRSICLECWTIREGVSDAH